MQEASLSYCTRTIKFMLYAYPISYNFQCSYCRILILTQHEQHPHTLDVAAVIPVSPQLNMQVIMHRLQSSTETM
jgi:hypothetical protein